MNVSSSIALQIAEPAKSYSTLTDIASSTPTQVVSSIQINPIPTLVSILTAAGIIICCLVIAEAIIAAIICYKKKKRQSRRIYPAVHDERHMYDANCIITVLFQLFIITVFSIVSFSSETRTTGQIHEIPTENGTMETIKESTKNQYSLKSVMETMQKKSQKHNYSPTKKYGSKYL